jgi:hypothetical protein
MALGPRIESLLTQAPDQASEIDQSFAALQRILYEDHNGQAGAP